MKNFSISVPHTGDTPKTVDVDGSKLNDATIERLAQIAFQGRVRSAVNNAFTNELDKAEVAAREAFDNAEAAKKAADKTYKVQKFDSKAFRAAFVFTTDPLAKAQEAIDALYKGEIRERGTSSANKLLNKVVKNNLVMAMVGKGKKQRDALKLVGDDPLGYIDRTARKRAGDDEEAYKAELAKLEAQYVTPARLLLGDEPETPEEATEQAAEESAADDLV